MLMIALVCGTFVMLVLVCVVAVCVNFAQDGFEDVEGFHVAESPPRNSPGPVVVNREMKISVPPAQPVTAPLELAAEAE
jgi:hypothetical protein